LPFPHPPTIYLFGGKLVHSRRLVADMWAMDLNSRTWEKIDAGDGPGPRYFHSMDVWQDKLVCFGGMSESEPLAVHNDIWFFDCPTKKWLPQPSPTTGLGLGVAGSEGYTQDPGLVPQPRYAHLSSVSRGKLVVSGGQHSDNSWIYEINVFDLTKRIWVSRTEQPELQGLHSKGAYRSVATSSKQRVIVPNKSSEMRTPASASQSYSIDEEGEGGDIWTYSNYDFSKVRRELELISPYDTASPSTSANHIAPSSFAIRDYGDRMKGTSQPPGLRFPTGGIVGNYFILCGLYLASSSAAFSVWALNLTTMSWKHIEPQVLGSGSWNRAVLWPEQAKLIVFGHQEYDLAADYGRRAVNLDHVAVISLETYGIYRPPRLEVPIKVQEVGLSVLDEKLASDFEVICDDGRRIKCSKTLLSQRWPWFAKEERELAQRTNQVLQESPALDINDSLLGSFTPARLASTNLTIPEPFPVCVALVQYFYTLSLSTPLQNRAPVLSALLFLAKQYKIERLSKLVVHALHERLDPNIALGVYEIATLAGEQNLQVRALNMAHSAKGTSSSRPHRQPPSSAFAGEGGHARQGSSGPSKSVGSMSESSQPPSSQYRAQSSDDTHHRRARADSCILPMDEGDIQILIDKGAAEPESALDVKDSHFPMPPARSESPIDPGGMDHAAPPVLPPVRRFPPRLPRSNIPPSLPPSRPRDSTASSEKAPFSLSKQSSLRDSKMSNSSDENHYLFRSSSPTASEATSAYPATPSEGTRDPFFSSPMQGCRSASTHSYGSNTNTKALQTLAEFDSASSPSIYRHFTGRPNAPPVLPPVIDISSISLNDDPIAPPQATRATTLPLSETEAQSRRPIT
ncbi:hypothetical protein P7C73_g6754, partial [Tremellales sp. Uapishka_1]